MSYFCKLRRVSLMVVFSFGLMNRSAADFEPVEDLPSERDLYRSYLESNGGRRNIESIKSVQMRGTVRFSDGPVEDFQIFRKYPESLKIIREFERVNHVTGVFDGNVWMQLERTDGEIKTLNVDAESEENMLRNRSFKDPFHLLEGDPKKYRVEDFDSVEDCPAVRIKILSRAKSHYEYIWVCRETSVVIGLEYSKVDLESDQKSTITLLQSDYVQESGIWFPKKIRHLSNGELVSEIKISKIETNVGLFDEFFQPN